MTRTLTLIALVCIATLTEGQGTDPTKALPDGPYPYTGQPFEIGKPYYGPDSFSDASQFDRMLLSRLEEYERECWADSTFVNDGGWWKESGLDSMIIEDPPKISPDYFRGVPYGLRPFHASLSYRRPWLVYFYRDYHWSADKFDGAEPVNPRWVHNTQPTFPGFIQFLRKRVKP